MNPKHIESARPKNFTLSYDRRRRIWIAWQGTIGHLIGPVGRKNAAAKAQKMVIAARKEYIPYIKRRRATLKVIRDSRPFQRWVAPLDPIHGLRDRLKKKGLRIIQGCEAIQCGLIPDANPSFHYLVCL